MINITYLSPQAVNFQGCIEQSRAGKDKEYGLVL